MDAVASTPNEGTHAGRVHVSDVMLGLLQDSGWCAVLSSVC